MNRKAGKPELRFHRRLAVQLGVTVALVTGFAFAFTFTSMVRRERETLTRELTLRLLDKSRSLSIGAVGPLLRHDPELGLHPLIRNALDETPDLVDLVVLDETRRIQGHRDLLRVGTIMPRGTSQVLPIPGLEGESVALEGSELVIEGPIRHLDRTIGWLVLRASRRDIETKVHRAQTYLVVVGTLATLLTILAVTGVVRINLRPLGPLRQGVERIGAGDLRQRVPVRSRNELGLFAHMVNTMAENLESAQATRIQKERLDRELEIARELQSMLLPDILRPAPGYSLEAHYVPALEVSGDYYDAFALDEHRLALAAADVSGKGIPGLVLMAMLRTTLRGLATADADPVDVLVAASRTLRPSMRTGMFVTCVYGVLDARSHSFAYASAGHCAPLSFGPSGVRSLPARGKPIGLFDEGFFRESLRRQQLSFGPGDGLLLYTDGLVEAMNRDGEQLGTHNVIRQAEAWNQRRSGSLIETLLQRLREHCGPVPPGDDLTLLALQRQEAEDVEPAHPAAPARTGRRV
ncbi:MAG TPA: SpoIIE family protein phosphatase [Candidatus Krumholzibacteria bacterium]|nr:SpoIIE family protein phosphatase [Candidatus Krumholzibacteria bacterium]